MYLRTEPSSLNCRRARADPHQCQWHDNGMTIGPRISSRAEPSNHACFRLDETAIITDEERKYKFLKEREYKHQETCESPLNGQDKIRQSERRLSLQRDGSSISHEALHLQVTRHLAILAEAPGS